MVPKFLSPLPSRPAPRSRRYDAGGFVGAATVTVFVGPGTF